MFRSLVLTTAIVSLSACATTNIAKTANLAKKARTAQQIGQGLNQSVNPSAEPTVSQADMAILTSASPINAAPLSVPMKKTSGSTKILNQHPRIAIAGYNVGSFIDGKRTGKAKGGFMSSGLGAAATVNLTASGIDDAMVQRIATAAHADLVAQMTAAGIALVDAPSVASAVNAAPLKFEPGSYTKKFETGGGKKSILVAGPEGVGVRNYFATGKTTFGGNGSNKISQELGAVILLPNLDLDFSQLRSKGLGNKASASGELQFAIAESSVMSLQSFNGKGGGWLVYGVSKPVPADGEFAVMSKANTQTNALEQGLGAALGIGTRAKKVTNYTVSIDQDRYEALALKAAKGWNAAFVAQILNVKAKA